MAAVTIGTAPSQVRHIIGDLVIRFFNISGVTGSTLDTGMRSIQFIMRQTVTAAGTVTLISSWTVDANGVITFASSAPMVNEIIMVIGRIG